MSGSRHMQSFIHKRRKGHTSKKKKEEEKERRTGCLSIHCHTTHFRFCLDEGKFNWWTLKWFCTMKYYLQDLKRGGGTHK